VRAELLTKLTAHLNAEKVALIQLSEGFGLTRMTGRVRTASGSDRIVPLNSLTIIHEDIARVRYLVENGFRLLLGSDEKTAAMWKEVTAQVDQRFEKIADDLLPEGSKDNLRSSKSACRQIAWSFSALIVQMI